MGRVKVEGVEVEDRVPSRYSSRYREGRGIWFRDHLQATGYRHVEMTGSTA